MTSSDIIKIIKSAAQCNVKSLNVGELSFTFFRDGKTTALKGNASLVGKQTPEEEMATEQIALLDETLSNKEDEIANLLITDPVQYEELISQGELIDAKERDEDLGSE